jgi:multidrug resistance efflux pump
MPAEFERTAGALEREPHRRWIGVVTLGLVLVALWGVWLCTAQVSVRLTTEEARLEVSTLVHPVRAEVGGRVVRSAAILDRPVREGDLVLELDASEALLAVEEARARIAANQRILADLRHLARAEQAVIEQIGVARDAAVDETNARADQATAAAHYSKLRAEAEAELRAQGFASELDSAQLQSEARGRRSLARAQRLASRRLAEDHQTAIMEQGVELEQIELRASELMAAIADDRAKIRRLELDIERRTIRAPVEGRLGWVGEMSTGLVVEAGEHVATVIPPGELRIVAHFPVRGSRGRVRAGQRATLRLHAYPWTQYGVVTGVVARVASEPSENRLRVEVQLDAAQPNTLELEHGLEGALEVAVERVTPLTLLLRAVGTMVDGRDPDAPPDKEETP